MRASVMSLFSASLILALPVCGLFSEEACSGGKPKNDGLPFRAFTQAWEGDFIIVSTRYDHANLQMTWVLEAKKDLTLRSYRAELNDPDGVKIASATVKLDPKQGKVKKGTQIRAVISLIYVPVSEVGILNIRERKPLSTDDDD